ncbi:hypothetical protein [Methylopila sp. 73B]|uniref:hypothetical protein n=1 Tax=Methylopila sp. 73B TaxID=1120792 RepID=UPI0018CC2905|nr:hypothetical protein [Methylopila sp. 73B]
MQPSEIGELDIFATQSKTSSDFLLGLAARFGQHRILAHDWSKEYEVSVRTAYIHLETSGCEIDRDDHVGSQAVPETRERSTERSFGSSSEGSSKKELGGSAGVRSTMLGPTPAGELKGSTGSEHKRSNNSGFKETAPEVDNVFLRLPGSKWRVCDYRDRRLEGSYKSKDHFCKINYLEQKGSVSGVLKCFPKDMEVVPADDGSSNLRLFRLSANHSSVIRALIAKHLRELNPTTANRGSGEIVLATCSISYEKLEDEPHRAD